METLIYKLKCNNIRIDVVSDQLKLEMPPGFDFSGILAEVRKNKEHLIAFIKEAKRKHSAVNSEKWFSIKDTDYYEKSREDKDYETTHQQKKSFFRYLIAGSFLHNQNFQLQIEALDIEAMRKAIFTVVKRHDSLRTYLLLIDGQVRQKIYDDLPPGFEIGYLDLSKEKDEAIKYARFSEKATNVLFDLQKAPFIAFTIVVYSNDLQGLYISMHHAISDDGSVKILKHEIMRLYTAFKKGEPNPLPEQKMQYLDYSRWANRFLKSEKGKISSEFYRKAISRSIALNQQHWKKIGDPRALTFGKISYKKTLEEEIRKYLNKENIEKYAEAVGTVVSLYPAPGASYKTYISPYLLIELRKLSMESESTLFMTLTAILSIVFYKTEDIVSVRYCLAYSNRVLKDFESIVGWLTSEIIICIEEDNGLTFNEFVKNVTDNIMVASDHRFYAQQMIMKDLDLPVNDLSPIMLNFLSVPDVEIENMTPYHSDIGSGLGDLKFTINENINCISINTQYNKLNYSPAAIENMFDVFFKVIHVILKNRDIPLSAYIQ